MTPPRSTPLRDEGLLRDCGSVIAALFLACAVILPLLEPTGEAAQGGSGAELEPPLEDGERLRG